MRFDYGVVEVDVVVVVDVPVAGAVPVVVLVAVLVSVPVVVVVEVDSVEPPHAASDATRAMLAAASARVCIFEVIKLKRLLLS